MATLCIAVIFVRSLLSVTKRQTGLRGKYSGIGNKTCPKTSFYYQSGEAMLCVCVCVIKDA